MDRLYYSMLLDFYGEMLTEKQRECCDLYYNEDLSLAEIAEQRGISRQGVWDNIRHAESSLLEFESKTGIVKRFTETKSALENICNLASELDESQIKNNLIEKLRSLMDTI